MKTIPRLQPESRRITVMAKISSGLTLSTDYFMRNFYKSNRTVSKKNGRSNFSKIELSYEDSRALSRAAKRMLNTNFDTDEDEDADIGETMKSKIEAFVNTYNNALETGDSNDYDTNRYLRQLKTLSRKHSDELSDIGITVEKDGTLTINEDLLKMADNSKVRKVFSSDNDFSQKSLRIAKKLNNAVQNNIFAQVTGTGLRINITLEPCHKPHSRINLSVN